MRAPTLRSWVLRSSPPRGSRGGTAGRPSRRWCTRTARPRAGCCGSRTSRSHGRRCCTGGGRPKCRGRTWEDLEEARNYAMYKYKCGKNQWKIGEITKIVQLLLRNGENLHVLQILKSQKMYVFYENQLGKFTDFLLNKNSLRRNKHHHECLFAALKGGQVQAFFRIFCDCLRNFFFWKALLCSALSTFNLSSSSSKEWAQTYSSVTAAAYTHTLSVLRGTITQFETIYHFFNLKHLELWTVVTTKGTKL